MSEQLSTPESKSDVRFFEHAKKIAVAFARTEAVEESNDSNIEGWYEQLEYSSLDLLTELADKPQGLFLSEVEEAARDTAALYSLMLGTQARHKLESELYRRAGVEELLLQTVKQAVADPATRATQQSIASINAYTTADDLKHLNPNRIGVLLAKASVAAGNRLVTALQQAGTALPVLGADGLYDEEREDEDDENDD